MIIYKFNLHPCGWSRSIFYCMSVNHHNVDEFCSYKSFCWLNIWKTLITRSRLQISWLNISNGLVVFITLYLVGSLEENSKDSSNLESRHSHMDSYFSSYFFIILWFAIREVSILIILNSSIISDLTCPGEHPKLPFQYL